MTEKEFAIILLNVSILFFQLLLRAEIKRIDEKITIFAERLKKIENIVFYNRD